ncbi:MAG: hypothetical protein Q9163_000252 [Psora crenata]
MAIPPAYHGDSDADDEYEYERSVMTSPIIATDDENSPTDTDPLSTEPTPTAFGHQIDIGSLSPGNTILAWTTDQCADYISTLGLSQYCDSFLENEISGEALVALRQEELKEMGIISIGHRLTILKGVYDVKVNQGIPIDPDDYKPPSAEASAQEQTVTMADISRIIKSIETRDQRIQAAEAELRKITEEYRKLRDELLPVFRMAKDRSQPLPYHPSNHSPDHPEENGGSPMTAQLPPENKPNSILSRKFSTKRLLLGSTPKSSSPTNIPQSILEGKPMADTSTLDPSAAAIAASNHLTAGMNGGSQPSTSPNQANIPSPTSPNNYSNHLQGKAYREQSSSTARTIYSHAEDLSGYSSTSTFVSERDRGMPTPTPTPTANIGNLQSQRRPRETYQQPQPPQVSSEESQSSGGPGVEVFKSFRVSMEDPCEKVLPAALKKYNIHADWRNYALYIVFGDQERCLGLKEKPLILFKQLDREGKKPMFMLRKHAAPLEGHSGPTSGAGGGGRLPFNFCAISLQPFTTPVCTADGTIFDIDSILPWLHQHGTDPVSGKPLNVKELIKLHFVKNEQQEYVDPVTFKVFTHNSHIVAIKPTGNVFGHETVDRLNVKAKMWRDLVSDEEFGRKDIITLQDPHNVEPRNLSSLKYIQGAASNPTPEQRRDRGVEVNKEALGSGTSVLKGASGKERLSKPEVGRYISQTRGQVSSRGGVMAKPSPNGAMNPSPVHSSKDPSNKPTAVHTTGRAAASLTSTGLTPHTSNALAELSQEEYLLQPKRVKQKGYATIKTNHGDLTLELYPEYAPKAVWSFVKLAQKGYYNGVTFHRNIRNFMLQGGDPSGSGRGGSSIWGKPFADEWAQSPLSHDSRGLLSMANKGKDTNTSQFFITHRQCPHLNRKHTIFGRVVAGLDTTLSAIENVQVSDADKRPLEDVVMEEVNIFVDPFEEFLREQGEREERERVREEVRRAGGTDDEKVTWTGKRIRTGDHGVVVSDVGKYLENEAGGKGEVVDDWGETVQEHVKKKAKSGGGFGNFDSW